ncbi:hypothetical protein ACF06D_10795 [Streptomyces griseoluteus]|uniref:hypothetical protein n=1 Tax=Streptomyces griseoluteus TaxID=29306 RepID=UPI0036F7057F
MSAESDFTPVPEWLGQTVLMVEAPSLSDMTGAQRAGDACLWCQGAHDLEALDPVPGLGCRACGTCWTKRRAKVAAYLDWAVHVESCSACAVRRCADSLPIAEAYTAAHDHAVGTDEVTCLRCRQAVRLAEPLVMPYRWSGPVSNAPYYSFLHAGDVCPAMWQRGEVTLRAL